MYKYKKILAIVPARGGSKGIKNKNLKKIKGKSLLKILFEISSKSKLIDNIVLSSDSEKIKNHSREIGYEILFTRPKKLSGDKVPDMPVLRHALIKSEKILKKKFDLILMLQVTSPLRKNEYINKVVKKIIDKGYDSVWTISKVDRKFHPDKQLIINNRKLNYFTKNGKNIIARQQLNQTYSRNGAVYGFTRKCILNKKLLTNNSSFIITKSKQLSIDTISDLKLAAKFF